MSKGGGHECKYVLEDVGEWVCTVCGEYVLEPDKGKKRKEKAWEKDRALARGKGSKYDY